MGSRSGSRGRRRRATPRVSEPSPRHRILTPALDTAFAAPGRHAYEFGDDADRLPDGFLIPRLAVPVDDDYTIGPSRNVLFRAIHAGEQMRLRPQDWNRAGVVNDVYLGRRKVLRVATRPWVQTLAHEAAIAGALPPEVNHPPILRKGTVQGHDFLIQRRIPGVPLGSVFATLSPDDKLRALQSMARILRAVREIPLTDDRNGVMCPPGWSPTPPPQLHERYEHWLDGVRMHVFASKVKLLLHRGYLEAEQAIQVAHEYEDWLHDLEDLEKRRPNQPYVPIHGDAHLMNWIWDPSVRDVVALIDWETAGMGCVGLDAIHVLRGIAYRDPAFEFTAAMQPALEEMMGDVDMFLPRMFFCMLVRNVHFMTIAARRAAHDELNNVDRSSVDRLRDELLGICDQTGFYARVGDAVTPGQRETGHEYTTRV